ncbi:hypothetical protein LCGC14_0516840 [marine sediment metagenome]|uniref:HTH cro/C1-type domain-containing protein n=1 Tax=marine sediment metagenome TaxID=412755 RepID=A0A0F9RZM1_9ZZZZ
MNKNNKLKAAVIEKNGSQYNFEEAVGLELGITSKWINNRRNPTEEQLKILTEALGKTAEELGL